MGNDYVRDITPPGKNPVPNSVKKNPVPQPATDAVPSRSIRNITVTRPHENPPAEVLADNRVSLVGDEPEVTSGGNHVTRIIIGLAFALLLAGAAFLFVMSVRHTTVSIVPHAQQISVAAGTHIGALPAGVSATTSSVTYTLLSASADDVTAVKAAGTAHAEEFATGNVTFFNAFSDAPVKLIKNTRIATPDGLVFRIHDAIAIPGRRRSGSSVQPGTLVAPVFADAAGSSYNGGPFTRLTLPALKGSSSGMYDTVYASSASPFSGGFSGDRPSIDPQTLLAARTQLRDSLEKRTRDTAVQSAPGGTLVVPGLTQVAFESMPIEPIAGGGAQIHEKVVVQTPAFDVHSLAHALASLTTMQGDSGSLSLISTSTISLALSKPDATFSSSPDTQPVDLSVTGATTLVWDVDVTAVANALAGKNRQAFQDVIKTFNSVASADATIAPFWSNSFPTKPADIIVTVTPPKAGTVLPAAGSQ